MFQVSHLLSLIDAYREKVGVPDTTISYRLFNDTKKVASLRGGADIQLGIFNRAVDWLSANWPEGAAWPDTIPRPAQVEAVQ